MSRFCDLDEEFLNHDAFEGALIAVELLGVSADAEELVRQHATLFKTSTTSADNISNPSRSKSSRREKGRRQGKLLPES